MAELQASLVAGRRTSRGLVEAYLARIAALDRRGPELRALLEINPEALAIADALDAERRAKGARGPLHGIPILLKDNIATHDLMTTTAGSLALAGSVPARDAWVARRLREAGAVLLGKANLSEWANFRSTRSSSGWSARGGQCCNPYALDRSPSGSSSGSAVAAAANLCAAAVGTETDGSIVSPAGHCALVGIKPTVGLLSRSGIVPIAHSQDTAGPLARTVADAAILLGAMAGGGRADPGDPATAAARGHGLDDYTPFLRADGLKGARLGVARAHLFEPSAGTPLIEEAIAEMRRQGAVIVDPADVVTAGQLERPELEVLLYEFKADLDAYLADLSAGAAGAAGATGASGAAKAPGALGLTGAAAAGDGGGDGQRLAGAPVRSLADLIAFNERHRTAEMPFFGQELLERAQAKGTLADPAYRKALARCRLLARRRGIDATLARHRLDAIVAPTGGTPWLIDLVNGDAPSGGSSTPAAVAGYPSITVPAGQVFGLPVGLSFIGAAWSEPTLIRLAYAFEQATRHRLPPRFQPTAELPAAAVAGAPGPPASAG
ncbi:MAG TPA: amidase family protein [Thermoanaerobaculia bacterium]|nr:amidase family protein [Thermoanaerobaculia bacterium]